MRKKENPEGYVKLASGVEVWFPDHSKFLENSREIIWFSDKRLVNGSYKREVLRVISASSLFLFLQPIIRDPFVFMHFVALTLHESGGNNSARGKNKNGTFDFGVCQLNSKYNDYRSYKYLLKNLKRGASIFADHYHYFLKVYRNKEKAVYRALEAYNRGRFGGVKWVYTNAVLEVLNHLYVTTGEVTYKQLELDFEGTIARDDVLRKRVNLNFFGYSPDTSIE